MAIRLVDSDSGDIDDIRKRAFQGFIAESDLNKKNKIQTRANIIDARGPERTRSRPPSQFAKGKV